MLCKRERKRLAKAQKDENQMDLMTGVIGSLNDQEPPIGEQYFAQMGAHRELLTGTVMGQYYALARRGKVFIHTTAVAGVAFPVSTTTAPVFGIWNKAESKVCVIPLFLMVQYVSGTAIQTGVDLSIVTNTGSGVATAAPLSAATEVDPRNAFIGGGNAAKAKGISAATLTTAGTSFYKTGFNTFTGAATVPIGISNISKIDFDGTLIIPPGNLIYLTGNAASGALYGQMLVVAEVPY